MNITLYKSINDLVRKKPKNNLTLRASDPAGPGGGNPATHVSGRARVALDCSLAQAARKMRNCGYNEKVESWVNPRVANALIGRHKRKIEL